ncbi:hypothetical protein JHK85_007384 [Glycine max]|nr:hypothetical protein JHK85_007384 [Glycine max]
MPSLQPQDAEIESQSSLSLPPSLPVRVLYNTSFPLVTCELVILRALRTRLDRSKGLRKEELSSILWAYHLSTHMTTSIVGDYHGSCSVRKICRTSNIPLTEHVENKKRHKDTNLEETKEVHYIMLFGTTVKKGEWTSRDREEFEVFNSSEIKIAMQGEFGLIWGCTRSSALAIGIGVVLGNEGRVIAIDLSPLIVVVVAYNDKMTQEMSQSDNFTKISANDSVSKVLEKDHTGHVRCLRLGGLHNVAFWFTTSYSGSGPSFSNSDSVENARLKEEQPPAIGNSSEHDIPQPR